MSDFIDTAFKKCLPRKTRKRLADEYPRPAVTAAKVPTTDSILVDFMASDFPKKQDEQLSKIQVSVIAACSPVANLWSELDAQEMKGTKSELIPADVVMGCVQATLTLIGNASNYISTLKRVNIIKALPKSRENLAKILKQVSRQDSIGEGPHLFGDDAMDQVSKRITTLESFRKSANNANPKKHTQQSRFLLKRPGCKVREQAGPVKLAPVQKKPARRQKLPKTRERSQRSSQTTQVLQQARIKQQAVAPPPVGGRLSKFLPAWEEIDPGAWVKDVITLDYRLEFSNNPPTRLTCQISSLSPAQAAVMDQEIHDLLGKEAIETCLDSAGFFSPIFIVPKKDGGWWPIINLKALNQEYIIKERREYRTRLCSALNVCGESRAWNANHVRLLAWECAGTFVYYNVIGNGRQIISIPSA